MKKIYVLSVDHPEIENYSFSEISDEQFIRLGKGYTIEEFLEALNYPNATTLNIVGDWFKLI